MWTIIKQDLAEMVPVFENETKICIVEFKIAVLEFFNFLLHYQPIQVCIDNEVLSCACLLL